MSILESENKSNIFLVLCGYLQYIGPVFGIFIEYHYKVSKMSLQNVNEYTIL